MCLLFFAINSPAGLGVTAVVGGRRGERATRDDFVYRAGCTLSLLRCLREMPGHLGTWWIVCGAPVCAFVIWTSFPFANVGYAPAKRQKRRLLVLFFKTSKLPEVSIPPVVIRTVMVEEVCQKQLGGTSLQPDSVHSEGSVRECVERCNRQIYCTASSPRLMSL